MCDEHLTANLEVRNIHLWESGAHPDKWPWLWAVTWDNRLLFITPAEPRDGVR